MDLAKPLPVATDTSRPYWNGLAAGKVMLQQCDECNGWVFYPRSRCSHCLSDRLTWREVTGRATLYTYTIARAPTSPHFADESPQKLAVVELEQGVRMTTTLVNVDEANIRIGMALKPYFDAVSDDAVLLRFQPV